MGVRGSALSRTVKYFQEGDIHEVQFVLSRGQEILKQRSAQPTARKQSGKSKPRRKARAAESSASEATQQG